MPRRRVDLRELVGHVGVLAALAQDARQADDRVHRGADLVAHRREELGLRARCLLRGAAGLLGGAAGLGGGGYGSLAREDAAELGDQRDLAGAVYRVNLQGTIDRTGNSLDLAVIGKGFLQIQMPDGTTAYTRDGALQLDANGQIVTSDGYPLIPSITFL